MKRNLKAVIVLTICTIFLTGCKNNPKVEQPYQPKFSEERLIGEWVESHKYKDTIVRNGIFDHVEEVIETDTFVFLADKTVILKKRHTRTRIIDRIYKWGTYELEKGRYWMKNDTLTIKLDYPNIQSESFGEDPNNIFGIKAGIVYSFKNDSISNLYSVMNLSIDSIEWKRIKRWSKEFTQDYPESETLPEVFHRNYK